MKYFILLLLMYLLVSPAYTGSYVAREGESFAMEYAELAELLSKVNDRQSAIIYKSQISEELERIKNLQPINGENFQSLSQQEQQAFIKKFQNNRFHCGEVTKVMQERNRIFLNAETRSELGLLLSEIP